MIVGRGVAGRYVGAALGEQLEFGRGTWKVVGLFESGGASFESEVWADVRELASDAKRPVPYSGLRVRVAPGADIDALARRIGDDPRWALEATARDRVLREAGGVGERALPDRDRARRARRDRRDLRRHQHALRRVQARTAEIGTLRALGFSRGAILGSFLIESLLMARRGLRRRRRARGGARPRRSRARSAASASPRRPSPPT